MSSWTVDELLDAVVAYVEDAHWRSAKARHLGYECYQRALGGLPSGCTLRNRPRATGLATWAAVLDRALRRDVLALWLA